MYQLSPHPFTLRQLQYAVAVAEEKSFRRAAELCRVAQPSLSAQIQQMEESLGIQLFERDRRRVLTTAAGEEFLLRARRILLGADELAEAARRRADPLSGTLKIGILPSIGPYFLPDAAALLRERFPKLTILWLEDKTAALVEQLTRGSLDGAIVALEADLGAVDFARIGRDPFVFAAPHGHTLARSAAPIRERDLQGELLLLLDDGHCFRDQVLEVCSRTSASELGFRATSLTTLVQMVASGAGVTLLPEMAVPVENRRGELVIRRFAEPEPARTLVLMWRRGSSLESALRPIADALRAARRPEA